jgi:hypothetical protein
MVQSAEGAFYPPATGQQYEFFGLPGVQHYRQTEFKLAMSQLSVE